MPLRRVRCGRTLCAAGALVALASGARSAAAIPPQQVVIFDGSPAAADTLVVSLTAAGLLLDLGLGGFQCPPGVIHVSPGGPVTQGPAQIGAFFGFSGLGSELLSFLFAQPGIAPATIEVFEDDCDVVDQFAVAQSYLSQSVTSAQSLVASVATCLYQVLTTYCSVLAAVEAATIIPDPGVSVSIVGGSHHVGGGGGDVGGSCTEFYHLLVVSIPYLQDAIQLELAICSDARAHLLTQLADVGVTLTDVERNQHLLDADFQLEEAQAALSRAQSDLVRDRGSELGHDPRSRAVFVFELSRVRQVLAS